MYQYINWHYLATGKNALYEEITLGFSGNAVVFSLWQIPLNIFALLMGWHIYGIDKNLFLTCIVRKINILGWFEGQF